MNNASQFSDIHAHVIAAIDDGAESSADSIAMLRQAYENGTRYIVATPHVIWNEHQPAWATICDECQRLNELISHEGIDIVVYPGAEVALTPELLDEIKPGEYCLNQGKYMLVELPMLQMPQYAETVVFGLQAKGISPIMAHPERYPDVVKNPAIVLEWLQKGLLLQVNSKSITGLFGPEVQKCVLALLANRVVSFVASDAHSAGGRNTKLSAAYELVGEMYGVDYAEQIFITNPHAVLDSKSVSVVKPESFIVPRQRSFFARLFGGK